jgi:hypothetical protein
MEKLQRLVMPVSIVGFIVLCVALGAVNKKRTAAEEELTAKEEQLTKTTAELTAVKTQALVGMDSNLDRTELLVTSLTREAEKVEIRLSFEEHVKKLVLIQAIGDMVSLTSGHNCLGVGVTYGLLEYAQMKIKQMKQ